MYVDESGDPGNGQYASPHYILTGLIIEEKDWKLCLDGLIALRKAIYLRYGLRQRTEFHSSEIFRTSLDTYKSIMKRSRVEMLKFYVEQIPIIFSNAKSINICINKSVNPLLTNF